MWDGPRLRRVLRNLVSNAVKYSPRGGEVTVTVRRHDGHTDERADGHAGVPTAGVQVLVADRGIGIPAADVPRIFERFHRAGNVGTIIQGTGIGLADVQQVVERHGGSIAVDSEEGTGTTFAVWLPLT